MQNDELAKNFAPILLFHPQEKNFPSDPIKTFQHYSINNSLEKVYLSKESKQFFPRIPFQVHRIENKYGPLRIFIQYWIYYTDNLPQIFQIHQEKDDDTFFEWAPLGSHCSDYESVTIELDPSQNFVSRIMPFAHGGSKWIDISKDEKTHIILYVALNSHAMYLQPRNVSFAEHNKFFLSVSQSIFGKQTRLDIVDVVDPATRLGPSPHSSKPANPRCIAIGNTKDVTLIDLSDDSDLVVMFHKSGPRQPAWYRYKGHWGKKTQQQNIKFPPHYVPHRIKLKLMLWISIKLQLTYRFVRNARAPSTPWYRQIWRDITTENDIQLT